MIVLTELVAQAKVEGYEGANAEGKVCQDIILRAIAESGLKENVTIKGGVVMRSVTKDVRRATVDIDLDFIKYSLDDESIRRFVKELNCLEGLRIEIVGDIEELSQQEYRGKRVYVQLADEEGNSVKSKIDIGVHVNMDIEQEEYCFDVCLDNEGASLLINSKEQIFTEKLRSLLRFGSFSTRYKDVFDMYYLSGVVDKDKLSVLIKSYILDGEEMRETSMGEVCSRVENTFGSRRYRDSITNAKKNNWLGVGVKEAMSELLGYLKELDETNL